MNELIFNGKRLSEFGAFYDSHQAFNTPERDLEYVEILGRDGDLIIDNDRFKNIEINFPCYIPTDFLPKYRSLMAYLNSQRGYKRLEYSQEPDYYRLASFAGNVEASPLQLHLAGRFTLPFICKPQRYLKSGEIPVSASELWNPTYFDSHPLIRCYGSGSLMINSQTITVASNPYDYVDIDCDIMDAFYGSNNANSYVSFNTDSVVLRSGTNGITHDMTKVEITPRWYEI